MGAHRPLSRDRHSQSACNRRMHLRLHRHINCACIHRHKCCSRLYTHRREHVCAEEGGASEGARERCILMRTLRKMLARRPVPRAADRCVWTCRASIRTSWRMYCAREVRRSSTRQFFMRAQIVRLRVQPRSPRDVRTRTHGIRRVPSLCARAWMRARARLELL
jgi:hypothetical protein